MRFRWWYVSMGATSALVLVAMMYLGTFLCVPVENDSCTSLLPMEGVKITASNSTSNTIPITPPPAPSNPGNSIPAGTGGTVPPTGNKIDFTLSFQISPDFSKYGFNAPIGSTGANPDITVKSGDTVTIHLSNPSKSFHAFGVVIDPNNPSAVLWDSAFKTPDSPMKPGESGDVTFVAGTSGLYHYICTVPGHATLGMDGNFIIKP
jgi:uncharacterized cupredoxin-like copper-binding protein